MRKNLIRFFQVTFCLGVCLSLFPTQIFAQETIPVLDIQDQLNEEEMDQATEGIEPLSQTEEVIQPEPVVPEVIEPETTEPEVTEPEITEPEITEPEVIEPEITEPEVIEPEEVTPEVIEPEVPTPEIVLPEVQIPVEYPTQPEIVENLPSSIETIIPTPSVVPEAQYEDKGYEGKLEDAIIYDNFITKNLKRFLYNENPFMVGQCTWFAWSRFYQIYGFDSGARGNGKTNALEIVKKHGDKFELSSTPAAGAVFSIGKNTLYPQYGHVGFIEAYDGEYIWISEGNVKIGNSEGNLWFHKVKWEDFKAQYPDVVFAVPKVDTLMKERFMDVHETFLFLWVKKN